MTDSSLRIIVTGLIAQHPLLGGVTWDYAQYPLGLARLGHDVYYFEDSGEWPYNLDGGPNGDDWVAHDCKQNVKHLQSVMSRYGLENKWAYRFPVDGQWYGLSERERAKILNSTDLLINVSGTLENPELYREADKLVYVDSDPVFTQIKLANSHDHFYKRVDAHDVFFTFGECLPQDLPALQYNWRATRQPIVLSEWDLSPPQRDVFTTIMSWASYQPLNYAGNKYGQKDIEFSRFLDLPRKVGPTVMEVALGRLFHASWQTIDEDFYRTMEGLPVNNFDWSVRNLLTYFSWNVVDAMDTCRDVDQYRHYIQSSKAEWSVAKNGYVLGQPGWFSCRSACYLAAGKPVVVQDTGFSRVLPTGEGILRFKNQDDAVAAIQEVNFRYTKHSAAARAIAEEYFDSEKVLARLIEESLSNAGCPA